jgi:hypothetical protein
MGWLSGWGYRKSHVINPASGAGTNYQVRIVAHYGSGVDSGADVYLNSKCRTDFGDIRFTDDDGTTLLDYWMEEKVDSDYAVFWVEVADDLSTNPATIYIYYGKADATTTSNGSNTFLWFNDFSSVIGFERFPYDGPPSWGTEDGTAPTAWSLEAGYLKHVQANASSHEYALKSLVHSNVAIGVKVNLLTASAIEGVGVSGRYTKVDSYCNNYFARIEYYGAAPHKLSLMKNYNGAETNLGYYSFTAYGNTWYKIELRMYGSSLKVFLDDVERVSVTDTAMSSGSELGCFGEYDAGRDQAYDDFHVRKYVEPEPSHGAWGSEETPPPPWGGSALPQLEMAKAILGFN